MSAETIESAAADAVAAPLDLLLTDAALGVLNRVNPGGSGLRLGAALAARPRLVASRTRNLLGELTRIATGTSQVQPSRRDRRFADPGWVGHPLLRRAMQAYLAAAQTAEGLAQDADLDWSDTERVGFVLRNLIDALAPSNNPVLNPAAVKAAIDTGGGSALAGLRHFAADMASPPRIPSMVEPDAFKVGVDLAVTPGAVVARTEVFELIQYRPATPAVRQVPLLIVPPTINKFYVIDLAPGRSMAEYLVGRGFQVFMMSWRNPDSRHAKWDFNTYGQAVLDAMDAVARITRSEQTAITGVCSGGIIAAMVAAHLAHAGRQDRIAALTLLVTVLDQARAGRQQRADAARRGNHARFAGGPVRHRPRQLPGRRDHRPHLPVAELLPLHRPAGREQAVRAVDQRAHRRDGEPARQRQGQVPVGQGHPAGPGRMAAARRDLPRVLVAGPRGLAGRALRRGGTRPSRAGRRRAGADLRRAGNLRL